MAQNKNTKKKFTVKGSSLVYIFITAAVLIYLVIGILPERTLFIYKEKNTTVQNVKIYTFKEEEYVYINSDNKIDFKYDSETKVSASTLLSDNYTINTDEYLLEKIEIINFMLANPNLDTREKVYESMSDIRNQLSNIDFKIEEAEASQDSETKQSLVLSRQSLQHSYEILKGAMQYILTQNTSLYALLEQYQGMLGSGNIPLTLGNLNFTVFGYISYSTDGYENAMNFDNLLSVNSDYLDKIDAMTPIGSSNLDKYVVKSSATSKTVLVFSLPLEETVSGELSVIDKYNSLYSYYDVDTSEGGYYNFLYRRVDIMNTFPSINIRMKDGSVYSGYLINVQRNNEEKLLYVAFRDNIENFSQLRLFNADVETETYDCFNLPKSCVKQDSEGSYITVLTESSERQRVAVNVYKESGGRVILRCDDNKDLQSGTQVLLNGD